MSDIDYRAVVVVGLPKLELSESDLELLNSGILEEFRPEGRMSNYNIVGLSYAETDCYSNQELEWQEWVIETLKEQFFTLTGKDAKIYLTLKGY